MTAANLLKDISGTNTFGLTFSANKYSASLAASTDTTLTVPAISPMGNANAYGNSIPNLMAVFTFEPGAIVWVAVGATAAVPVAASFGATSSEMNPAVRYVKSGDVLHFFCATANTDVSVMFYSLD
ncbi:MAG: hypothetical protein WC753_04775 [Candidatus Gracilibacteria bacterium]|jgi:hypothetical protein